MSVRVLVLLLAGCALFGGAIAVELMSAEAGASADLPTATRADPGTLPRGQKPHIDDLLATILNRPLFNPTRQPAGRAAADQAMGLDLAEVRLTGIVIEPERHLAIFAVPGAKPIVRSEGETMKDWRLDSITPQEVILTGPAGTRTLQPKSDTSLVRPATPRLAPAAPGPPSQPKGPSVASPRPPGAAPLKAASAPAARQSGAPMSPNRPLGTPRERR